MNICILKLSSLGDICRALPSIITIKNYFPTKNITWVIDKKYVDLIKFTDINIELFVFDKEKTLKESFRMKNFFDKEKKNFDILLHMQPTLRANFISLFIKAPIKIGFSKPVAKEGHFLFINKKVKTTNNHPIKNYLQFCEKLKCLTNNDINKNFFNIPNKALEYAENKITKKTFLINASTFNDIRRNWSPKKFAAIIKYCYEKKNLKACLIGSNNKLSLEIAKQITILSNNNVLNLVGKTDLAQLLALIKKSLFIISVDSAPVHLADAIKTPVIGLYANTNPITSGSYFYQRWTVNHYPCKYKNTNKRFNSLKLMESITKEEVIAKIEDLLSYKKVKNIY